MNERKVYCACCGRDITQRLKFWYGTVEHKEPFCYDCSQKRVKREKNDDTRREKSKAERGTR